MRVSLVTKSNKFEHIEMLNAVENTRKLGHTFFILWFTDPPTLFFDEMEKNKIRFLHKFYYFFPSDFAQNV